MTYRPHSYQMDACRFILSRPSAGLFLDPGLGKTSTTLMALSGLKRCGLPYRALIIAPLRVIYSVWPEEIKKWPCFNHLSYSIIHGDAPKRREALGRNADVYLTNPENVQWLFGQKDLPAWDVLVIDESTKFKNRDSKRFKVLRHFLGKFKRRIILTGTPSPNSLLELWGQIFLLDLGERLGPYTYYRDTNFLPVDWNQYQWKIKTEHDKYIGKKISDITLRLDAKDLLDLPPLIENDIKVSLPPAAKAAYDRLDDDLHAEIAFLEDRGDKVDLTASSAGVKYGMLRQLASGGVYTESGGVDGSTAHEAKIEALADLIEELGGKPLLVCYHYRHELKRLLKKWPKTACLNGEIGPKTSEKLVKDWNSGRVPLLFAQPMSMGHGLNLQGGGTDLCWFTLADSLEIYQQANARLYRQGQTGTVKIHRILAEGTVDTIVAKRLSDRDLQQKSLLELIKLSRMEQGTKDGINRNVPQVV
jgi:SNF2 family DNA or RNA helicase